MKFVFHPEALFELEAATDFFADRQKGLEIRFIDAVYSAIHRSCDAPERWRRFDGDIRRLLVHVFPYAVLYSIEDEFLYIIAVMHCNREPGYWHKRIK